MLDISDISDFHRMNQYPMDPQPSHVIMNLEEELKHNSGIGNGHGNAGEHNVQGGHAKTNGELDIDKAKEAFADMFPNRKIMQRKKHWPLTIYVRVAESSEVIKLEINSSLKIKSLKA